jgi:hypothetical protein
MIGVNHNQRRLKKKAAERLRGEEGLKKRKKRCADVEPVLQTGSKTKASGDLSCVEKKK